MSLTYDDEELMSYRKKLKTWRDTGYKATWTILKKLSEYDIPKEQIKRTKISKVIIRISRDKAENEEELNIIKLSQDIAKNMKMKFNKFKEEEEKTNSQTEKKEKTDKTTHTTHATHANERKKEKHEKKEKSEKNTEKGEKSEGTEEISLRPFSTDKTRETFCKSLIPILEAELGIKEIKNNANSIIQEDANIALQEKQKEYIRNLAIDIEEELMKKNKEINIKYREDARTIYSNLKIPQNAELRQKIIKGEVLPCDLAKCDPLTLQSKISKETETKIMSESLEGSQLDWDKEKRLLNAKGGGVRCVNPKCGSDKTFTTTAQIRRADEGMTEFHECLVCGKKWKH